MNEPQGNNHINQHLDTLSVDVAYIRAKVEGIAADLAKINGRVNKNEDGLNEVNVKMAYWGGGLAALIFIVGIIVKVLG